MKQTKFAVCNVPEEQISNLEGSNEVAIEEVSASGQETTEVSEPKAQAHH